MTFRATAFSIGSRSIYYANTHNSNLLKYQNQISSGVRIERPSQDPIGFRTATSLESRLTELTSDLSSLSNAEAILNTSTVQLQEFADLMVRAKTLTQQGIQAFDDNERNAFAIEVDEILNSMQRLANSEFNGAYLYGGTKPESPPFSYTDPSVDGQTLQVDYTGGSSNSFALVGQSVSVETYYNGETVFGGKGRESTVIYSSTGTKPGGGTDTMVGRATLQITHVATTYVAGSGLTNGTDSASLDTVIGPLGRHVVTLNDTSGTGASGTISLNGGAEIPFTNADNNLRVEGLNGEVIYVDTSAITPGFNGTVDLTGSGELSVDGGATRVPIDFSDSQIVTDSVSGNFVTINSQDTFKAADDFLEFPGTADVFQVLFELKENLRNTRELSSTELADSLDRQLGELDRLNDQALFFLGDQGTSLQSMDQLRFRIEDLKLSAETQLSEVKATDFPEAVLRLENTQALLQYTYSVTARISDLGLLQFLR